MKTRHQLFFLIISCILLGFTSCKSHQFNNFNKQKFTKLKSNKPVEKNETAIVNLDDNANNIQYSSEKSEILETIEEENNSFSNADDSDEKLHDLASTNSIKNPIKEKKLLNKKLILPISPVVKSDKKPIAERTWTSVHITLGISLLLVLAGLFIMSLGQEFLGFMLILVCFLVLVYLGIYSIIKVRRQKGKRSRKKSQKTYRAFKTTGWILIAVALIGNLVGAALASGDVIEFAIALFWIGGVFLFLVGLPLLIIGLRNL